MNWIELCSLRLTGIVIFYDQSRNLDKEMAKLNFLQEFLTLFSL
ncbi:MAG: hypothetical protein ACP5HI_07570 [Caldimicrobium sp.]